MYFKFNSDLCFRVRNEIIDCIAEYYCATWFTKDEEDKAMSLYFLSRQGLTKLDLTEKLNFKKRIRNIYREVSMLLFPGIQFTTNPSGNSHS